MKDRNIFLFGLFILSLSIFTNFLIFKYTSLSQYLFYILILEPLVSIPILSMDHLTRSKLAKSLLNWKGIVILASTFVIWVYIILILELGSAEISYTFESLYYPSFFEQAIFAMIGIECLGIYLRRGTSIILSAIFYEAYYFVVLINSLPGFPGIYAPFFVIDSFAVGIIYIGIYSVTRSIYFAMALQLSLILMAIFIPPIPAAFFYTLVPS